MNISKIVDAYLCTSCGACSSICPVKAISFQDTAAGYILPVIDNNLCTQCGLCVKVCPGEQGINNTVHGVQDFMGGTFKTAYLGRATNEALWRNGQSGGSAGAILSNLFMRGDIKSAIVASFDLNASPRGYGKVIHNANEISSCQKSQYTPIPLLVALRNLMPDDFPLAIVGLPCHFHGLINSIEHNPKLKRENILLLGLFCQKVMTSVGIDYLLQHSKGTVRHLVFRDTSVAGFPGNPITIDTKGRRKNIDRKVFGHANKLLTPLRCNMCFDKTNILADVVFGDPHRIEGITKQEKLSAIIARTEKGASTLNNAIQDGHLQAKPIEATAIIQGQNIEERLRRVISFGKEHLREFGVIPGYVKNFPQLASEEVTRAFNQQLKYARSKNRMDILKALDRENKKDMPLIRRIYQSIFKGNR